MKALVVLPLALVCLAGAQAPPRLDAALAVDIRVKTMEWHPSGETLLYSREEATGVGLGIYRLGDPEGKVALHLAKDDRWSSEWFQGSSSALVTVSRKLKTATGDANSLWLMQGPKQDAVGVLVAANANSAAIAPAAKAVAYITDGALFVRRILK